MNKRSIRAIRVLALVMLVAVAAGCHQDMWNQPRYKALAPSDFFADGRSARPLVAGVAPYMGSRLRDETALAAMAKAGMTPESTPKLAEHFFTGRIGDTFAATFPMKIDRALLDRGQEQFAVFCTPCHGFLGNGKGFVATRGFPRPPANFHEQRLRDMPPGYFFDTITNGFGVMYSYANRIPPEDRWAITAYIQALQLSQRATTADAPADELAKLRNPKPAQGTPEGQSEDHGTH